MSKCTRKGCGKEFDVDKNEDESCSYHTGAPVFHEGLKSWSCCNDINKPVTDFDEFMKLPGCTQGRHTTEKAAERALQTPTLPAASASSILSPGTPTLTSANVTKDENGTETYSTASLGTTTRSKTPFSRSAGTPPPPPVIEDEDDLDAPAQPGAKCLRLGCGKLFVNQEASRLGDGEDAMCVYHPSTPIFHEGSKGYVCCKPRVLDFDDFLKIQGCKTGKHVFVKKAPTGNVPERVKCRIDHYQTPTQVHVSVFAKKVVKDQSSVTFDTEQVHLDLVFPDNRRFIHTLNLFGPISPATSSCTYFGTKVELLLLKEDKKSWNMLEKPLDEAALPPGYTLTFGVGGRTGSIGAKAPILDNNNKSK